jgi:ribonuclease HII
MSKRITLKEEKKKFPAARFIAGVDEVGRGALAGPVCVCAVLLDENILKDSKIFKDIRDSKKLTAQKREYYLSLAKNSQGLRDIKTVCVGNKEIDRHGIAAALRLATESALSKLSPKPEFVFFDGGLRTIKKIPQQTTVKGDEKIFSVALASVCAKVSRDRLMVGFSKKHPGYHLEVHKGYGTKKHFDAIKKNGISKIHRHSYLKSLT